MTLEALDNLVKIRRLNKEPPDQNRFDGMVKSAKTRLLDIEATGLSDEGRFALAYGAAHSLALAALRWHGYRSDIAIWYFDVSNTRLVSSQLNGACSINATI